VLFEVYGQAGLLEIAPFVNGSSVQPIDGTIGYADYGFLGIASEQNITHVRIVNYATEFDNLTFSPVPEPVSLLLLGPGGLGLLRRRRR
jgi:hypothetical protein